MPAKKTTTCGANTSVGTKCQVPLKSGKCPHHGTKGAAGNAMTNSTNGAGPDPQAWAPSAGEPDWDVSTTKVVETTDVGTEQATQRFFRAVNTVYGTSEALSVNDRAMRFREASRTKSDLSGIQDQLAEALHARDDIETDKDSGLRTTETPLGATQLKVGSKRVDWDSAAMPGFLAFAAEQDPVVDDNGEVLVEESVVAKANEFMAAGQWKTDGLRKFGLEPGDCAKFNAGTNEDGSPLLELVPAGEEPSTATQQGFRQALTGKLAPADDDSTVMLAAKHAHVERLNGQLSELVRTHSRTAASKLGAGGAKVVPGVGAYEAKRQGSWSGWNHDAANTAVLDKLKDGAAKAAPKSKRFALAAERYSQVRTLKGKAQAFKKANPGDEDTPFPLYNAVAKERPGRKSAKTIAPQNGTGE